MDAAERAASAYKFAKHAAKNAKHDCEHYVERTARCAKKSVEHAIATARYAAASAPDAKSVAHENRMLVANVLYLLGLA